jgi:hypothetical protein
MSTLRNVTTMGNNKFPLQQVKALSPKFSIASLVVMGVVISTLSSFYLSGWSGGSGARSTTIISVAFFLTFFSYYFWVQRIFLNFPPLLFLTSLLLPSFSIIAGVAVIKRDLSFIVGLLVFISTLGLGKLITEIFAPHSISKYLAYLPVGQLTLLTAYLLVESRVPLFLATCVLMFAGFAAIWREIVMSRNFLAETIIRSQKQQQNSFFRSTYLSLLTLLLIGAHSPILGYDALAIKIWLPKLWSTNDSVFIPTDHLLSGVSGSFSFPVLASIKLGGLSSGNSIQFLSLAYATFILLSYLKKMKSGDTFLTKLLVIALIGVPANLFQISNSYDDIWMMVILLCGVLFAQENYSSISRRQCFFSALVIGSIASVKFSLLPVAVAVVCILVIRVFFVASISVLKKFNFVLITVVGFLVSLIPFYGWKWTSYGNPAWPLYNKIFKAPGVPFENIKFNLPYSKMDYSDFLLSPITTVIKVSQWGEEGAPGSYNAIFSIIGISAILSVIAYYKSPNKVLLIANIAFLFSWLVNFRYSRYLLHIFPISILTIVNSQAQEIKESKIWEKFSKRSFLGDISIFFIGLLCAISFTISNPANSERIPYRHIFSNQTKIDYLEKTNPNFRLIQNLNNSLPQNASVVSPQLFERAWLRPDIKLYHFWEANEEILERSWKVFVTATPLYPAEFYSCRDSVDYEFFTINPPSCEKETLTTDPNS